MHFKKGINSTAQRHMPVIPGLGRLRQDDCESEDFLGKILSQERKSIILQVPVAHCL
jgi:hypothetical protein